MTHSRERNVGFLYRSDCTAEREECTRALYCVTLYKLSKGVTRSYIGRKDAFAVVVRRRFYIRLLCAIPRDISAGLCKRIVPRRVRARDKGYSNCIYTSRACTHE